MAFYDSHFHGDEDMNIDYEAYVELEKRVRDLEKRFQPSEKKECRAGFLKCIDCGEEIIHKPAPAPESRIRPKECCGSYAGHMSTCDKSKEKETIAEEIALTMVRWCNVIPQQQEGCIAWMKDKLLALVRKS
jgi:hypothetical protein